MFALFVFFLLWPFLIFVVVAGGEGFFVFL